NESLRASGMAHILAISGLHMTLIVGSIFFGLRFAMALHPTWPLRYPTKKVAAAAALAVATAYLAISGAGLATQRAYITLAVMLVALLLDRRAISLRNVAVAAAIVLIMQPHAIFLAGFQMSFAAVASLVASYRAFGKLRERAEVLVASGLPLRGRDALIARWFGASYGVHQRSWWQEGLQWCLRFFAGIALTSLIAGLGTGLFAAWHFHRVAPMGLLANLLAMPFVTVAVMPGLLTAMFSLPFGLDPIFLGGAGRGIETVQSIASWSANIGPHGRTGAMPLSVFLVCLAGLAAAICLRGAAKLVAAPIATAGIMVWSLGVVAIDPPEVLTSPDRGLVAVRKDVSNYQLNSVRSQAFTRDLWLRAYAPSVGTGDQLATMQCDAHGCFARSERGLAVSWAKTPEALREDCAKVDLVVTKLATPEICAATIVNAETEGGALAINSKMEMQAEGTNRVHIRTANALVHRPWNRRTEMAFQPSRASGRD
ncbi:MAG: ComEC/Rec2 family competence protein, partial [Pseudomonadota bacterium]